jgi:phosphoenolpyruvate---glycerone phosphotransferase subunit DhaL
MAVSVAKCKEMMLYVADGIISNAEALTEADRMGDADHGTGMFNGFQNLKRKISASEFSDLSTLFKACGNAIMMSAGGASGVIFGTLFRDGGAPLLGLESLDSKGFHAFLEAGLKGVMKRGGAKPGDKTMIDALHPAAEATELNMGKELGQVVESAYLAAKVGSDSTKEMIASTGRMKSLGERTKGYADPGSITMHLILKYMSAFLNGPSR